MIPDWMRCTCPNDCLRCDMELVSILLELRRGIIDYETHQDEAIDIEILESKEKTYEHRVG
jgi:hypothetical protein